MKRKANIIEDDLGSLDSIERVLNRRGQLSDHSRIQYSSKSSDDSVKKVTLSDTTSSRNSSQKLHEYDSKEHSISGNVHQNWSNLLEKVERIHTMDDILLNKQLSSSSSESSYISESTDDAVKSLAKKYLKDNKEHITEHNVPYPKMFFNNMMYDLENDIAVPLQPSFRTARSNNSNDNNDDNTNIYNPTQLAVEPTQFPVEPTQAVVEPTQTAEDVAIREMTINAAQLTKQIIDDANESDFLDMIKEYHKAQANFINLKNEEVRVRKKVKVRLIKDLSITSAWSLRLANKISRVSARQDWTGYFTRLLFGSRLMLYEHEEQFMPGWIVREETRME